VGGVAVIVYFLTASGGSRLDSAAVEVRVEQILEKDFGIAADSGSVDCPLSMPAEADATYICSYSVDGQSAEIKITMINERQYLVGSASASYAGSVTDPLVENTTGVSGSGWQMFWDIGTVGYSDSDDELTD
jgi:hypothetical protein